MAALMLKSEFIICPASSLCFEALACGIKIIGGYFEENQKEFYRYLAEKRIIFGLGNLKDLNINSWTDSLEHAFAFFKDKQHQFGTIDGKQGERFRKAFMELSNE